ncbi:hypothetical protein HMN09_00990100 [Mycena chlorophos]|uniref:BTB domain-containing protein n=1 Tax=Mycena chlorophos TaxID=658473 RepID=A0A8H6SK78_MYCCL|nr:hypothetical protein HMN09_00990100 [Mycena chlorophos]
MQRLSQRSVLATTVPLQCRNNTHRLSSLAFSRAPKPRTTSATGEGSPTQASSLECRQTPARTVGGDPLSPCLAESQRLLWLSVSLVCRSSSKTTGPFGCRCRALHDTRMRASRSRSTTATCWERRVRRSPFGRALTRSEGRRMWSRGGMESRSSAFTTNHNNAAMATLPPAPSTMATAFPRASARDETYYFETGDCTFLVEGVLFKISRLTLCRDAGSMFSGMFTTAHGNNSSDSEPIPLDDPVEDFRALCWVMYALPEEMYAVSTDPSSVQVKKLLRILNVAHKYILLSYEKWAWMMLRKIPNAIPLYLQNYDEEELERMLDLGVRCRASAPELLDLVESAWMAGIKAQRVSYTRALAAGEAHGRRNFQADIYLELRNQLLTGPIVASPKLGFSHFGLRPTQLNRLLVGHALMSHCLRTGSPSSRVDDFDVDNVPDRLSFRSTLFPHVHETCHIAWRSLQPVRSRAWIIQMRNNLGVANQSCIGQHLDHLFKNWKPDNNSLVDVADYFLGVE